MASVLVKGISEEICDIASPFLIHLVYKVCSIHLRMAHDSPTTAILEKVQILKQALKIIGNRWLTASKYLIQDLRVHLY